MLSVLSKTIMSNKNIKYFGIANIEKLHTFSYITAIVLNVIANVIMYWHDDLDDSYIIFRYAQNLISGHGWVFNVGERYNASTSVLNTILISLISIVTGDPRTSAHLLGGVALAIAGISFFYIFYQQLGKPFSAIGSILLVYFLAGSKTWGLETNLLIALLLLFVLLESYKMNTWYLLGFLILTRPDAGIVALAKIVMTLYQERRIPFRGLFQTGIVMLPWFLFSILYFHQVLPATLQQKIWQGNSGLWGGNGAYLQNFKVIVQQMSFTWGLSGIAISIIAATGSILLLFKRSPLLYFLFFVCVQQLVYFYLNVPGYHWYFAPFAAAVVVMAIYTIFKGLRVAVGTRLDFLKGSIQWAAIFLVLVTSVAICATRKPHILDIRNEAYKALSYDIMRNTQDGTIAMLEVGTVAYYTQRPMLDFTGLTNPETEFITGRNNDRFFERLPEIVVFPSSVEGRWEAHIYQDPRFSRLYEFKNTVNYPGFWAMSYYVLKESKDS